jgi:hypothetical protein
MVNTSGTQLGSSYAFPHISFDTKFVGPAPFTAQWRNTIGVVGVFKQGPELATIRSREDFIRLYGEDDSPGSIFVRQAMMQGATNFIVSRVLPNIHPSSGSINFVNSAAPDTLESETDETAKRTVGLISNFEAITEAQSYPGASLGTVKKVDNTFAPLEVFSNSGEKLGSDFLLEGYGTFKFKSVNKVSQDDIVAKSGLPAALIQMKAVAPNAAATKVVELEFEIAAANSTDYFRAIHPGMILLGGVAGKLEVVSYPYKKSSTKYAVLVRGVTTSTTVAGDDFTLVVTADSQDYSVFAYAFTGFEGSALPTGTIESKSYRLGAGALGFIAIQKTNDAITETATTIIQKANQKISLKILVETSAAGVYEYLDTGIKFWYGNIETNKELNLSGDKNSYFSISAFKKTVTVGATEYLGQPLGNSPLAFPPKTSSLSILTQLKNAILADNSFDGILQDVYINDRYLPYSLIFETVTGRLLVRNLNYTIKSVLADDTAQTIGTNAALDLKYSDGVNTLYGVKQTTLGERKPFKPAGVFLYDKNGRAVVYVEAISPGLIGNNIRLNVTPQDYGRFSLDVFLENSSVYSAPIPPESYQIDLNNVDLTSARILELADSFLVRAYFVPLLNSSGAPINKELFNTVPVRTAPPLPELVAETDIEKLPYHPSNRGPFYLRNIPLTGGAEPAEYYTGQIPEVDYLDAIRRLENQDVAFISAPGISVGSVRYSAVTSELVIQANQSTPYNGLRIAILAAPKNLSSTRAQSVGSAYNSPNVVIVSGWVTTAGAEHLGLNSTSPEGFYAGVLATSAPQVSPAASNLGRTLNGVVSVDTSNKLNVLDAITRARVEVLSYDTSAGGYKFLNGLCSSLDTNRKWISLVRTNHYILTNLFYNLQWARSASNDAELRTRVSDSCDAFLESIVRKGVIVSYNPTVCNETNNTAISISQGKLNITVVYVPIFPADYINVTVVQTVSSSFVIDLAV